ncbi:MAG: hypothetical protein ACM3O6_15230, partial [Acidobacteriota bacterium]
VKETRRWLEDSERPPRTLADRLLAFGADFILAIAFFALSFIANVVASWAVEADAPNISEASGGSTSSAAILVLVSAFLGLVMLRLWRLAREYESGRAGLKNSVRDVELVALIVEQTVAALAKRQQISGGSNDSSGGSEAAPTSHTA